MKTHDEIEITCFEYILADDGEYEDYREQCEKNDWHSFHVDSKDPRHILEHAAVALWGRGFDMDGWYIK